MKKEESGLIYSPSDLINFTENEFITWMDRYYLEFPGEVQPDEDREEDQIFQRLGYQHEANLLQRFLEERREIVEVQREKNSLEQTRRAISQGAEIVYQAALRDGQFAGFSDFLVRVNRPSKLGSHSYEIWDTKLARKAKPYFVVQLCCYAEMLESAQGMRPEFLRVVLGDGTTVSFKTDDFFYYYLSIKDALLQQQACFNVGTRPIPLGDGRNGRWETVARNWLTTHDHPRLVAGISTVQIQRLKAAGIGTLQALADSEQERIPKMLDTT
jgi:uncharacterized protein